ncbi:MAG: D-cysteine desulfhydrase family protein [Blastocatellia bacterium]|nr:MAG: D-cysteine desulfhydrase family protein [Blastocatellia bacterium]
MTRLSKAIGGGPSLLVKRDDVLDFAFGGNKVRKLALLAAAAQREGADTLVTAGAIQSNHARVTAAAAAMLGMKAVLVLNGTPPATLSGNALLDELLGAEIVFVDSRETRDHVMNDAAERLRRAGRRPFVIPVGGSTPLGACGFALAMLELLEQVPAPDVIVHATSSGGTQAGLVAACRLLGLQTGIIGISADEQVSAIRTQIEHNVAGVAGLLGVDPASLAGGVPTVVDGGYVGAGYGRPTAAARDAIQLAARTEGFFLDPVYTGKAMAGLIDYIRTGRFGSRETILFWHTGGQPALFA